MSTKIGSKNYDGECNYTSISHEPEAIPLICKLLKKERFQLIVELGTYLGGLTMLMHEELPKAEIHTFDIKPMSEHWMRDMESHDVFKKNVFGKNVFFHIEDIGVGRIATPPPQNAKKSENLVNLLELPVKKLLYCDNGHKREEVKMYTGHLRPGDILGVHDVGTEINLKENDIVIALKKFNPHPLNKKLKKADTTSRFFVKR